MRKLSRHELLSGQTFSNSREIRPKLLRIKTSQNHSLSERKKVGKGSVTMPKFSFSEDKGYKGHVQEMPIDETSDAG